MDSPKADRFWFLIRGKNVNEGGWEGFGVVFTDVLGRTASILRNDFVIPFKALLFL